MPKYRAKLLTMEAIKWNGGNIEDVKQLGTVVHLDTESGELTVQLKHKVITVQIGDYIVKDHNGALWPSAGNRFEELNELIEEELTA